MNPPYKGNLHLKILEKALIFKKDNGTLINLSPVRWLRDPLAEYKKGSDWKTFKDIVKKIESVDVVSAAEAHKLFGISAFGDLGIYHITDNSGDILPKPFISQGLFDKVNLPTYQGKYKSLYDMRSPEGKPDYTRPFIKMSFAHGRVGADDWYDIITPQKELAMSKEQNKGGSGTFTFNFDTEEERDNFFAYCQTKFVKACNGNVRTNIRWPGYAIPFMPTYTHPWTDEDLYEYFNLTEDEQAVIKSTLEKYK